MEQIEGEENQKAEKTEKERCETVNTKVQENDENINKEDFTLIDNGDEFSILQNKSDSSSNEEENENKLKLENENEIKVKNQQIDDEKFDKVEDLNVYDVIIIGAGISGASAAYYLKKKANQLKVLVIEGKNRCGGSFIFNFYLEISYFMKFLT